MSIRNSKNVHRASTSMAPTATAARTLRYHTYSLTLLGHNGNRQMAIVAITVGQKQRENSQYTAQPQMWSKTDQYSRENKHYKQKVSCRLAVYWLGD